MDLKTKLKATFPDLSDKIDNAYAEFEMFWASTMKIDKANPLIEIDESSHSDRSSSTPNSSTFKSVTSLDVLIDKLKLSLGEGTILGFIKQMFAGDDTFKSHMRLKEQQALDTMYPVSQISENPTVNDNVFKQITSINSGI